MSFAHIPISLRRNTTFRQPTTLMVFGKTLQSVAPFPENLF